jgi:hypothetical protein
LREQGHDVRLIPAQYVKAFVKANKNDFIDAEAIAEAVGRPTMRFVPVKSDDQLDLQSLHRLRERWVIRRTAAVNQVRSLLLERGVTLRKGRKYVDQELPRILENAELKLSGAVRTLLAQLKVELDQLAERIAAMDRVNRPDFERARGMQTHAGYSGDRPSNRDCDCGGNRHRSGFRQRKGFCSLDWTCSPPTLDRREAESARHQQAWQSVFANAICTRCSGSPAEAQPSDFRPQ